MGHLSYRRCGIAVAVFFAPSLLGAQQRDASSPGAPPSASSAPVASAPSGAAAISDAQARFRRALELHDEGNLDAARTELRRAYDTAPNYKVLFNLAQVEFEMLDYPAALATFEKYLNEGGDRIPKERRAQVQSDIDKLRSRVGSIEIAVNVTGARVMVDDAAVGTTPLLHPVIVSAGRRRITVSRAGFTSDTRVVDVAGGDQATASFELSDTPRVATTTPPPSTTAPEQATPAAASPMEQTPAISNSTRSIPWVGWVATAVLAGGAGVTGVLAWQRSEELSSDRSRYGIQQSELDRLQKEAGALALASDILTGTAAFAGVLSLYLTLSSHGAHRTEQGRAVRVAPSLGFVSLETSF